MAHHIFPDLPCLPSNFRSRAPSGPFWAQQGHGSTQRNWIRSNFPLTARRKRHQAPGVPFVPKLLAMQAPVLWLRAVLTPKLRRSSNVLPRRCLYPSREQKVQLLPQMVGGLWELPCPEPKWFWYFRKWPIDTDYQVIQSDLFSKVKWPFKSLSDLQLEDQKVTLNHLLFLLFLWSFRVAKVGTQNTKAVLKIIYGNITWFFSKITKKICCVELLTKRLQPSYHLHIYARKQKHLQVIFQQWPKIGMVEKRGTQTLESLYQWPPSIERNQVWANGLNQSSPSPLVESWPLTTPKTSRLPTNPGPSVCR